MVKETSDTVTTEIENQNTGETEYFMIDKSDNTLYSSITGKTIDVEEEMQSIGEVYAKASVPPATKSLKISYYKIYNALDKAATATMVAALILSMFTAAVAIPVITTVSQIISSFSSVLSMVVTKLKSTSKTSKKHGVLVNSNRVTYKKHQGGKTFYYYKYKIVSLKTY